MGAFEYLSVLISIILGLALTQLLTGAGRLIRYRDRVRFYAPPAIWMVFLLVIIVQSWWTMFALRFNAEWTFGEFAVVLIQPTLVYLLVELILPDTSADGAIDMRAGYFRQVPAFFATSIAVLLASLVRPPIIFGEFSQPLDVAMHFVWITLAAIAIFWKRPAYHQALAPVVLLLALAYISVLFLSLE